MRVLMFGWEFPPFISGGLGTACHGIVNGLINSGVDVTMVLPTTRGAHGSGKLKFVSADEVPFHSSNLGSIEELEKKLKIIDLHSKYFLSPYYTDESHHFQSEEEYLKFMKDFELTGAKSVVKFTGNYGKNLFWEVLNYGLLGEAIGRNEPFDVIHAHDWLTYPAGVMAKRASGKKLVIHVHATEFDRSGENVNPDVYNIERFGMHNADRIIAVSHLTKNIVVSRYGIPESKVEVVHNAVNKEVQLTRLGIKKPFNDKIVLFLGRITMQKGPEYFIEAAKLVLKKMKNVRFVMAGSGDMMTRMIARMAKLQIADRFHFTGFLRGIDVERMFAMSDCYVMPSVSEPFGISAYEALLYDIPIIISKQSGVAEVLKDAMIVDFWDVNKLAEAMISILSDDELAKKIVDKCQAKLEGLGWDNAGIKIRDVYQSTLAQGGG